MEFIKNVLAVIVGLILFSFVAFFGFISLLGVLAASTESQVFVENNSVLLLDLRGEIHEQTPEDPFADVFNDETSMLGLLTSVKAIKEAANDERIEGILINTGMFSGGFGSLRELREAIKEFKSSGKFVYAYGEYMSEGAYYLASVADEIYVHPESAIEFNGLSANVTFFKGTLDKLGIEPQIFRVGDFKSAVEPFVRKDMSSANRLQLQEWLQSLNNQLVNEIAQARNLTVEEVMEISNSSLATNAVKALEYKLITGLAYEDQVIEEINKSLGTDVDADINLITTDDYYTTWYASANLPTERIAVVVAEGAILGGEGTNYQIGSDRFASTIRKLRKNKRVKAMVIRVNSPGGGMIASDVIWREIELARAQMPVIASMSDYATSGGYYLAMPCDGIVAHPTTLTGSIGVFGMLFNLGPFLDDKLGITHDVVTTGEYSDMFTVTRALSDQERDMFQTEVEKSYKTFIEKAAAGRGVDPEMIDAIASGRIWSGTMALENGLIDRVGTFEDALEMAAEAADLDDYQVAFYPRQKTFLEELLGDFGGQVKALDLQQEAGLFNPYAGVLETLKSYQGIQARLPFELELK